MDSDLPTRRHIVLNANNRPFLDSDAAKTKAAILSDEIGIEFVVIPYETGWAVTTASADKRGDQPTTRAAWADDAEPALVLRPALRAFWKEQGLIFAGVIGALLLLYFAPNIRALLPADPELIADSLLPWYFALITWLPIILAAVCMLIALYALLIMTIATSGIFANKYVIGTTSIEAWRGFILRTKDSVRIDDIRSIKIDQSESLAQRILGIGTVEFSTAGSTGAEVIFYNVSSPATCERIVDERRAATPSFSE